MKTKKIDKNVSFELLKMIYSSKDELRTADGRILSVSKDGSIGLLTLGYRGIVAWRKAKGQSFQTKNQKG